MNTHRRVVTTPQPAIRRAIDAADHLGRAAQLALAEGRSRAASELSVALRTVEAAIVAELRRRPEAVRQVGSAAIRYADPWPEVRAFHGQLAGRVNIDDLAFLFDLETVPLPRTIANMKRLAGIAAKLEGAHHE